jgi:hypothetical protein
MQEDSGHVDGSNLLLPPTIHWCDEDGTLAPHNAEWPSMDAARVAIRK